MTPVGDHPNEAGILAAWHANAVPWVRAVRNQAIASRQLVTDRAIVDAVLACGPRSAIDLGCGEGWLVRALAKQGVDALGVDAVPALIEAARAAGGGRFHVLDYAAIADGRLQVRTDLVICNFSLFGEASVVRLLQSVPAMLLPQGRLIVQTLHPLVACGDNDYRDGWRAGSWQGCGEGFGEAPPWYFRTLSGWVTALAAAGMKIIDVLEPTFLTPARPASLMLIAAVG